LQAIVPGISRAAVFWDPTTGKPQVTMSENAARALKISLEIVEVGRKDDVVRAFRTAQDARAQAISVLSSPFLASLYREIINSAAELRLPAIYQWKEHVEAGGLVSYGPNLAAMFRQAATIVVKVLKGAKPSDLPVEQPNKFELVINLKTARTLGIDLSPAIVARADELIE
jgi:putative ABC transport system substrate-binding protein